MSIPLFRKLWAMSVVTCCLLWSIAARADAASGATKITLEQAIQIALQRNHELRATRTTIEQSQADELTASLRPNPALSASWGNLPIAPKPPEGYGANLRDSSQVDVGLSYEVEINKRGNRMRSAGS